MSRHSDARIIRSSKVTSDASRLPPEFRSLLPLARAWAVGDDSERCALLTSRPLHSRRAMVSAVFPHFETLEAWIATEKMRLPVRREVRDLELLLEAATEAVFDIYLV